MKLFSWTLVAILLALSFDSCFGSHQRNSFFVTSSDEIKFTNAQFENINYKSGGGILAESSSKQFLIKLRVAIGMIKLQVVETFSESDIGRLRVLFSEVVPEKSLIFSDMHKASDNYVIIPWCETEGGCQIEIEVIWEDYTCATYSDREDCLTESSCGWAEGLSINGISPNRSKSFETYNECLPYYANMDITHASSFETTHPPKEPIAKNVDSFYMVDGDVAESHMGGGIVSTTVDLSFSSGTGSVAKELSNQFIVKSKILSGSIKLQVVLTSDNNEQSISTKLTEDHMNTGTMKVLYSDYLYDINFLFANMNKADTYSVILWCESEDGCSIQFDVSWNSECAAYIDDPEGCLRHNYCGYSNMIPVKEYPPKESRITYQDCVPYLADTTITDAFSFETNHQSYPVPSSSSSSFSSSSSSSEASTSFSATSGDTNGVFIKGIYIMISFTVLMSVLIIMLMISIISKKKSRRQPIFTAEVVRYNDGSAALMSSPNNTNNVNVGRMMEYLPPIPQGILFSNSSSNNNNVKISSMV